MNWTNPPLRSSPTQAQRRSNHQDRGGHRGRPAISMVACLSANPKARVGHVAVEAEVCLCRQHADAIADAQVRAELITAVDERAARIRTLGPLRALRSRRTLR